jgi:hypothetical protein
MYVVLFSLMYKAWLWSQIVSVRLLTLPLVICVTGSKLLNPSETQMAVVIFSMSTTIETVSKNY